ncbi:hypothetical protein KJY77_00965 [Canibacter sp. lx-72]|uniref:hypothetical protein n=1 Tax=Canibacter zhuwentaonis TaxID=2837491 RepID=UPI001BDC7F84|nr:hypothetical protein [Canibacter zhuwentaonis]MBT1017716.1 hypothetical protein [Canibacter zhuwentaonis]MBT1034870.1 hypothetical protein [Canibacter zhuwentaonis]
MIAAVFYVSNGANVVKELPFPAIVFGVIAFVFLSALALVTYSFRDVANRHAEKAEAYKRKFGGQAPHHR